MTNTYLFQFISKGSIVRFLVSSLEDFKQSLNSSDHRLLQAIIARGFVLKADINGAFDVFDFMKEITLKIVPDSHGFTLYSASECLASLWFKEKHDAMFFIEKSS